MKLHIVLSSVALCVFVSTFLPLDKAWVPAWQPVATFALSAAFAGAALCLTARDERRKSRAWRFALANALLICWSLGLAFVIGRLSL